MYIFYSLSVTALLSEIPWGLILLCLLFPVSLKVDCYLVCVVILNSELIFDRLHLETSSVACDEVLLHQIFFSVCFCWEYTESQYGVFRAMWLTRSSFEVRVYDHNFSGKAYFLPCTQASIACFLVFSLC